MRKKFFTLNSWAMAALFAGALSLTACSDDDDNNNTGDNSDGEPSTESGILPNNSVLQGSIASGETVTLSEGFNFELNGGYIVEEGATLVIEPGVVITAQSETGSSDYIIVAQGGKIDAQGTATSPIVMTAETPEAGAWGGIHICGRAPINIGNTGVSEVGNLPYGGTDEDDNSGILRYIRVEYAGQQFTPDQECNGFTFYGVGRGTTVEHLEAYKGSDDGFEWFGGTVNVRYLLSISNSDDSFDWTEGWQGNGQFMLAYQEDAATLGYNCDCLIEADNQDTNNEATPSSHPTLANLTLIGANNDEGHRGIRLRAGTEVSLYNVIVTGKANNLTTETEVTESALVNGESVLNYIAMAGEPDCSGEGGYSVDLFADANNHNMMNQTFSFTNTVVGTLDNGIDPRTVDSWFESAPYIGAVSESADWINEAWVKID